MDAFEVAVSVIAKDDTILVTHNKKWGAFALPMTKVRRKALGMIETATQIERWTDAAMRAVGECLGRTSDLTPKLLMDVDGLTQSDRSGDVNHYHFQLYLLEIDFKQTAPGLATDWLTTSQIIDENRHPISPTARELAKRLEAEAARRGLQFPPKSAESRRQSQASAAIITRRRKGKALWLVQWNENWGRYHLVGGHQEDGEVGTECLKRELREELDIEPSDYESVPIGTEPIKYAHCSSGSWQDTDYTIWPFRITLSDTALNRINGDSANRWITNEEIEGERCRDDKPVSPTMRKLLKMLGEM